MVKRRRKIRQEKGRSSRPKSKRSYRNRGAKSLKERMLTAGIWAAGLINLVLIASIASEHFISPNEIFVSTNTPSQPEVPPKEDLITVEVLNGCGVQGLANDFTEFLRDKKFDVVYTGNYPGGFDLDRTFVFDRVSLSGKYAKKVGEVLGVEEIQVQPQLDNSSQLMVTVLIGKDYENLKVYKSIR